MIRCYITDRLDNIERVASQGIELIQIRNKEIETHALLELTRAAVALTKSTRTKIVVNSRADIALAAAAHGVHLPSHPIPPAEWKRRWPDLMVGVSCHSIDALKSAAGADYAFFSPVFETPGKGPAKGTAKLGEAVKQSPVAILALGGITWQNAEECLRVGAAGIAGIRLFETG